MTYQVTTPDVKSYDHRNTYVSVEITIEGRKNPISVFIRYSNATNLVDAVNVKVNNASQRAYGSMGKSFDSIAEAKANYKGKVLAAVEAAIILIEEAYNLHVTPVVEEAPVQDAPVVTQVEVLAAEGVEGEVAGTYDSVEDFEAAVRASTIWTDRSGGKIDGLVHFSNGDSAPFRIYPTNYDPSTRTVDEHNGVVALIARLQNLNSYIGSEHWQKVQDALHVPQKVQEDKLQRATVLRAYYQSSVPALAEWTTRTYQA